MKSLFIPTFYQKSVLIILPLGDTPAEKVPVLLEKWAKWARVLNGSLWPISENSNEQQMQTIIKMADLYESYFYLQESSSSGVSWSEIYQTILKLQFQYVLQIFSPLGPDLLKVQLLWDNRNQNTVLGGVWSAAHRSWIESLKLKFLSIKERCPVNFIQTPFLLFHGEQLKKLLEEESGGQQSDFFGHLVRKLVYQMEFMPFIPLEKDKGHVIRGPWGP